ncbi:MAG: hypothetical protein R8M46_01760 [Ghiorsea sp.]
MTIGGNSWSSYQERTRVDSAKEQVVSMMQQSRIKALSSGFSQTVSLDYSGNGLSYNGRTVPLDNGIDMQYFVCGTCTASDPASDTIIFKRSGTVAGTSSSGNVKISSPTSDKTFIVMVNGATGRVDVRTSCSAGVCQ